MVQQPVGDHVLQLVAVVEVLGAVLVTEEQPVAAGVAQRAAFLQEAAERRDAGARADHDHRGRRSRRAAGSSASAAGTPAPRTPGRPGYVDATPPRFGAAGAAVAHHRHRQLHLVRADQRARRDRVVPRRQPHQRLLPFGGVGAHRELLDDVEPVAAGPARRSCRRT